MEYSIRDLQAYLLEVYRANGIDASLFMKLVEEVGEVAEVLNKRDGRKAAHGEALGPELASELADVIHYAAAIASLNGIDLNDAILRKDRLAAVKYRHARCLEDFLQNKPAASNNEQEMKRMTTRSFASLMEQYERLVARPNPVNEHFYNGLFDRYVNPVVTREHIPPFWMYDADPASNPYMMQRLGINATLNSGAIKLGDKYCLVVRVEGMDRKSFFAVAESDKPTEGFRFRDYPVVLPDTCAEETNVYDMRLTQHEDGWIYGVFCSESKDPNNSDLSAAVAAAGIVRTKDLETWERLPNLVTLRSPQQRNVVLHPEFVDGKYAFYTRPMDDFIETGSGGGIGFGLCEDILNPVIDEEKIISLRRYHTITEAKNGAGATPIKTAKGWIHIAHGVRNTAAGLRYVLYAFATDLNDPSKVIAEPSGMLMGPMGRERVGDVSNVVFTNGAIADDDGKIYIYYASSDTRMHVAVTDVDRLCDYLFNTPEDPHRSPDCVRQRCELIRKNLEYLKK